jgi:fluoroacetyl-CoA thioesterase
MALRTDSELSGISSLIVSAADTAEAQGSGDVPALATPRLISLFEAAAMAALDGQLPDDLTSVGVSISVDHLAPSPIGATVTATAVVESVDDAAIEFAVEAMDGDTLVGQGNHTRVVVERERFLRKLAR